MGLIVQGQAANPTYLDGSLSLDSGVIDPLAGAVNNLNTSGQRFASTLQLFATADVTLSGITNGSPNKLLMLVNNSAFTITLTANDSNSLVGTRFSAAAIIPAGSSLQLIYSAALAQWIPAVNGAGGGGAGPVILSNIISPTALAAGNTADYNPTGFATCNVMRLTPNAGGSTLLGLVAPTQSQQIVVFNIGAGDLTFAHEAGGEATVANRILCAGSVDYTVIANDRATLFYDLTSARWRVR